MLFYTEDFAKLNYIEIHVVYLYYLAHLQANKIQLYAFYMTVCFQSIQ